jgi:hypothetical protein
LLRLLLPSGDIHGLGSGTPKGVVGKCRHDKTAVMDTRVECTIPVP